MVATFRTKAEKSLLAVKQLEMMNYRYSYFISSAMRAIDEGKINNAFSILNNIHRMLNSGDKLIYFSLLNMCDHSGMKPVECDPENKKDIIQCKKCSLDFTIECPAYYFPELELPEKPPSESLIG